MRQTLADSWCDFEDVCAQVRIAFPDSPGHIAVARRWVMREPSSENEHCPACGQPRPDALALPKRHEVKRVLGATSVLETAALAEIGLPPSAANWDALVEWGRRKAEISRAPLTDLTFHAADWKVEPGRLATFLKAVSARWLCDGCAITVAERLAPASPVGEERAFADLHRALGEESPLLVRLEQWRSTATTPAISQRPCRFCRRDAESFVLPWFRMCGDCATIAVAAAHG